MGSNSIWWDPRDIMGSAAVFAAGVSFTPEGLGGGNSSTIGAGGWGGATNPICNGGIGGGGGVYAGCNGGNGLAIIFF